jgi:molybdopterin synthase catalytic subunit
LRAVDSFPPPATGDDWVGLTTSVLPVAAAAEWVVLPSCGAVVVFSGTSRDHSGDVASGTARQGVTVLEYEAYEEEVEPRLAAIVAELRTRWPAVGRVALVHRTGPVPVGESSVVVAVSAPHRDDAFLAARFGIDTLKATVPIWKKETWTDGTDVSSAWGLDAQPITDVRSTPPAHAAPARHEGVA